MYQLIRVMESGSIHTDLDTDDNLELIQSYYNLHRDNPRVVAMMLLYIDADATNSEMLVSYTRE